MAKTFVIENLTTKWTKMKLKRKEKTCQQQHGSANSFYTLRAAGAT